MSAREWFHLAKVLAAVFCFGWALLAAFGIWASFREDSPEGIVSAVLHSAGASIAGCLLMGWASV